MAKIKEKKIDHKGFRIINRNNGTVLRNIQEISKSGTTWHVRFKGSKKVYNYENLEFTKSKSYLSKDEEAKTLFEYLKECSGIRKAKKQKSKEEKNEKEKIAEILPKQYDNLNYFVDEDTVLAAYLNPKKYKSKVLQAAPAKHTEPMIFPFQCNASQLQAVKNALENPISVIEGPPGTGKTQTILNIIANLLISGKTVQVVSHSNLAIENVFKKLKGDEDNKKLKNNEDNNISFVSAMLGNKKNWEDFKDTMEKEYPKCSDWEHEEADSDEFKTKLSDLLKDLEEIFSSNNEISKAKQEIDDIKIERKHLEEEPEHTDSNKKGRKNPILQSRHIIKLLMECQDNLNKKGQLSFYFKFKSRFVYGIYDWSFYKKDPKDIVREMTLLFYQTKIDELNNEINEKQKCLEQNNAEKVIEKFTEMSMQYLKHYLYKRYTKKLYKKEFKEPGNYNKFVNNCLENDIQGFQNYYPIIFSTAYSSRNDLESAMFDYVIMDEASQVDVCEGALTLSNARNAVIVGDDKQLPPIIDDQDKKQADAILKKKKYKPILQDYYRAYHYAENSFLHSVISAFKDAIPSTLLCEHYRCHPKIINFCNKKFYDNQLIIIPEDNGEENVLSIIRTNKGNHKDENENKNTREIEEIKNIIKNTSSEKIGIISPYKDQVGAVKEELEKSQKEELENALNELENVKNTVKDAIKECKKSIEVSTVHKFQGQERDMVILTTVKNHITSFIDDPNLLNVAVSRAKKNLCIVTNGNDDFDSNDQSVSSNIGDLVNYVKYQNCGEVTQSKLFSIFDYLYKQYDEERKSKIKELREKYNNNEFKKLSIVSEQLMYALIIDVLKEFNKIHNTAWCVTCHYQLNQLIKNIDYIDEYIKNSKKEEKFNAEELKRYIKNDWTHLDFLIYSSVSHKPILTIEVDGDRFHKNGSPEQKKRDEKKDKILKEIYKIPLKRFETKSKDGNEQNKIKDELEKILNDMALILAAQNGLLERVKELLDKGADIHAQEDKALIVAAQYGHIDIVRELLDKGADIHAQEDKALIAAAQNDNIDIVRELLERGADVYAQNNYVLIWAKQHGYTKMLGLPQPHPEEEKNQKQRRKAKQRDLYNEPISDRYVAWMKKREKEQGKNQKKDKTYDNNEKEQGKNKGKSKKKKDQTLDYE